MPRPDPAAFAWCDCHLCTCPGCPDCIPVYGPPTPADQLSDPWEGR